MELSEGPKELYRATAQTLKGHERRLFMARVVKLLGKGGPSQAKRELGWDRHTIRKGLHELETGIGCIDNYGAQAGGGALTEFAEGHSGDCGRTKPDRSKF